MLYFFLHEMCLIPLDVWKIIVLENMKVRLERQFSAKLATEIFKMDDENLNLCLENNCG